MRTTRELALQILCQIEYEGAYPNLALNQSLEQSKMQERDRAFVSDLVYGVLRNHIFLDYVIRFYSTLRLKKIAPRILMLLRMSVYQLLVLKLPQHAVCHEAVSIAKKIGHAGSVRFVNAILRRVSEEGCPDLPSEQREFLSVKYSFPLWLIDKFIQDFGALDTEALLSAFQKIPRTTVRVNPLKTTPQELTDRLLKEQVNVDTAMYHKNALYLSKTGGVGQLSSYQDGWFSVQDEGAMMVVPVLDAKPGERIWDVCAAPGGKTVQIAEMCQNNAEILATDIHAHKLNLIQSACKRLGITCVTAKEWDATVLYPEKEYFDRVLVDAPCSGLGVLGRKSDIRRLRTQEDLNELVTIQNDLLDAASTALKPGGVLVYSTCTINPDENTGVVKDFLSRHPEFVCEDVSPFLPDGIQAEQKWLTLFPHIHGCDGFFICRMRKGIQ